MTTKESSSSPALVYAILVHVALIALLGVSLDWTPKITAQPQVQAMNAVVIDDSQRLEKKRAQQQAEQRKQENERLQALKEQQLVEEQKEQQLVEEQKQEERSKETKEKEQEKRAVAEQGKIKKQQEALREAKLKTAQEEQAKKVKQADKQSTELEEKRKAEGKRRIEAEEDALQEQLAAEQQRRDSDREKLANAALAKFSALIKQKVQRNWLRPQTARQGMSCKVLVRLTAKGEVLLARVVESSGDTAYDRSVEAAVYKASPLPLPQDVTLFDYFREINFVFKPEG